MNSVNQLHLAFILHHLLPFLVQNFAVSLDLLTRQLQKKQQKEFENNSFRSSVITYGGPPGAFGPQTSGSPTSFSTWASSVDLLPVPIEYTLKPISDIIPRSWKFSGSATVVHNTIADEWKRVVDDFFSNLTPHYEGNNFFRCTI